MLSPLSHPWTRRQKWLIVGTVLVGTLAFGGFICAYERYYRGPDGNILVGTWTRVDPGTAGGYYQFRRDGAFVPLDENGHAAEIKARCYAGGPNIYVRFPINFLSDRQLVVWHIVAISKDQFRVRAWRDGEIMVWRRIEPTPRI